MCGVDVSRTTREDVWVLWCKVDFKFFSSVCIKISCVDVRFVGGVLWIYREGAEEFLQFTSGGEDVDSSQVKSIIIEWEGEGPGNSLVQRQSNSAIIVRCIQRLTVVTRDLVHDSTQGFHSDRETLTVPSE